MHPLLRRSLVGLLLAIAPSGHSQAVGMGAGQVTLCLEPPGVVSRLALDNQDLPLAGPGGFSVTEIAPDPAVEPAVVYRNDFGADALAWVPTANANPGDTVGAVAVTEGDNPFVRVGEPARFGHGFAPATPIILPPRTRCEIAWRGRIPDGQSNFIVYVRVFDQNGKDITEQTPAPPSWTYSIYSRTHYRNLIAPAKAGVWEELKLPYQMPEGAHAILPAFCLWRGTYADVDAVTIRQIDRSVCREVVLDQCRLAGTQAGASLELELDSSAQQLALRAQVRPVDQYLRFDVMVTDTAVPPRPRGILLRFGLPVDLADWTWHRNWREDRLVGTDTYANTASISGHPVSFYPFSAVSHTGIGLALATPFGEPAIEHRRVSATGLTTEFALGLLPRNGASHPAKASFLLFSFEGTWGFRSAARAYYSLFAKEFQPRTKREGLWMFPMPPSQLPSHPEDFGFAFWEGWSANPTEQERARELGIAIHPYTEAWGMRQSFPQAATPADMPPVSERLAQLQEWAASEVPGKTWFYAPRHLAAQAALNSLPTSPDGTHPFAVDHYDVWNQWWRTNPDPNLPQPNRASLCWDYRIAPTLPRADGIYLDSLSYGFAVDYLNVNPAHLAVMADSPTFDPATGQPGADGIQHQVAFVRWLGERLHSDGKILQGNVFGIAHRFDSPFLDVLGCEVGSFGGKRHMDNVQDDETCCLQRFYANHRPVCNLLQEGNFHNPVPALTQTEMKRYLDQQLFYAFYPGVATIGGEDRPGYAGWKRYFRGDAQCDRDRELFKEVVPLIRRLNQAGWQPETGLSCVPATVLAERYGIPGDPAVFFTLRNPSPEAVRVVLHLDSILLGKTGSLAPVRANGTLAEGTLELAPWETAVLRLE